MRATTVRFNEDLWAMLEREAADQGTSAAQVIRDATIMRLAALAARKGDRELQIPLEDLAERSRRRRSSKTQNEEVRDPARLAAVRATGLLDHGDTSTLDRLADMARRVAHTPVGLVTLVDSDRQVFVSAPGLQEPWASQGEIPLSHAFCKEAVLYREPVVVNDARVDPVFRGNPAVTEMGITAYLGVPLITPQGHALGALCVIDHKPRAWTHDQVDMVETLARAAVDHLHLQTEPDDPKQRRRKPSSTA